MKRCAVFPLRVPTVALIRGVLALGLASAATLSAAQGVSPRWGAIAATQQWFGYAFDQPTRDAAERAARAQCERVAKRSGPCEVRTAFDGSCGALAQGNFGEWGVASASTREQAGKDATRQCNQHLPTEPCKVVVQVCSASAP